MPKQFSFLFLFIILIIFWPTIIPAEATIKTIQKTIILDPGHGGKDTGITTGGNKKEKHITLELAQAAARLLEDRYNIIFTRTDDTNILISERINSANQNTAHLFVSIHLHNHSDSFGFAYYYSPPAGSETLIEDSPKNKDTVWSSHISESKKAADAFGRIFRKRNKKPVTVSQAPAVGIKGTDMPAVLIEAFPISILPEKDPPATEFIKEYAVLIAKSIDLYFGKTRSD